MADAGANIFPSEFFSFDRSPADAAGRPFGAAAPLCVRPWSGPRQLLAVGQEIPQRGLFALPLGLRFDFRRRLGHKLGLLRKSDLDNILPQLLAPGPRQLRNARGSAAC